MERSEGGCHCGAIRYQIAGPSLFSGICHCVSCRRASGAATVAWATVRRADFLLLSGQPVAYQSSPGVTRTFCGRCGCALTYQLEKLADSIDVTIGSLDDPNRFAPTMEVWLQDKVSWQPTDEHLSHFPGSSTD